MTFGNAEVTKHGKRVFNLKNVMLLNFIVIKLQTIANMKVCIYISEEVNYVVNTS